MRSSSATCWRCLADDLGFVRSLPAEHLKEFCCVCTMTKRYANAASARAPRPAAPIRRASRRPTREPACLALGPSPPLTLCSPHAGECGRCCSSPSTSLILLILLVLLTVLTGAAVATATAVLAATVSAAVAPSPRPPFR